MRDGRQRNATRAFVVFTIAMAVVMVFPVFALGNRVEPFVLGLPFSMAWVIFWIGVEFIGLIVFFRYEHGAEGN